MVSEGFPARTRCHLETEAQWLTKLTVDCCCVMSRPLASSSVHPSKPSPVDSTCPLTTNWKWKCYVPLCRSPNRPTLCNQTRQAITNQSDEAQSGSTAPGECGGWERATVCLYRGSRPAGSPRGRIWPANYRYLFWLSLSWLMESEGTE